MLEIDLPSTPNQAYVHSINSEQNALDSIFSIQV